VKLLQAERLLRFERIHEQTLLHIPMEHIRRGTYPTLYSGHTTGVFFLVKSWLGDLFTFRSTVFFCSSFVSSLIYLWAIILAHIHDLGFPHLGAKKRNGKHITAEGSKSSTYLPVILVLYIGTYRKTRNVGRNQNIPQRPTNGINTSRRKLRAFADRVLSIHLAQQSLYRCPFSPLKLTVYLNSSSHHTASDLIHSVKAATSFLGRTQSIRQRHPISTLFQRPFTFRKQLKSARPSKNRSGRTEHDEQE
jgi:hypothetical protein